jgi:ABC-type Fe3+/spermidine/putrescine transport system ATPase subunit
VAESGCRFRSLGGSEFLLITKKNLTIGEKILVALRPEKIVVLKEKVQGFNHLEGFVEEVIYVGETRRYRVRLNDKESLYVKQQVDFVTQPARGSDKVIIGWPVQGAQIL